MGRGSGVSILHSYIYRKAWFPPMKQLSNSTVSEISMHSLIVLAASASLVWTGQYGLIACGNCLIWLYTFYLYLMFYHHRQVWNSQMNYLWKTSNFSHNCFPLIDNYTRDEWTWELLWSFEADTEEWQNTKESVLKSFLFYTNFVKISNCLKSYIHCGSLLLLALFK